MKKKTKQNPISLYPPKDMEEYGKRFVRLGEALQEPSTKLLDLRHLSLSCGLQLKLSLMPNQKPD